VHAAELNVDAAARLRLAGPCGTPRRLAAGHELPILPEVMLPLAWLALKLATGSGAAGRLVQRGTTASDHTEAPLWSGPARRACSDLLLKGTGSHAAWTNAGLVPPTYS